ncbi:D-2-hydroxyacid dehydrogenase [Ferrimonas senticii]|uniref:D-2-hydroxyacid dehydrogenase n=1 Tax=Ferrimonas senticii TaxID=394566 RepID=UPI000419F954|nr:D-2-hydroxyacid dehydrogenase [Ferrimonas senticii]
MIALLSARHFDRYQRLLAPYGIECTADPSQAEIWLAEPALAAKALRNLATDKLKPKWIASVYAGVDALCQPDLPTEYQLTNVREVFGPLMAQYVFAHLLSRLRELPRYAVAQQAKQWSPKGYGSLAGQTLLIAGTGNIGQHIAGVAKAFGMQVLGLNTDGRDVAGFNRCFATDKLTDAVRLAEVIVNVLPATAATHHLFNAEVFAAMPNDATFINVGRGSAVDIKTLSQALIAGELGQAVVDVFEQEPLAVDSPLWHCPNLTITPHIAAASFPEQIVTQFIANLERWQQGLALNHQVDIRKGY